MNIKLLGLLGAVVLLAGCTKTVKVKTPVNLETKSYAEALKSADKSCKADEDCTSVNKGCCMCDGYDAVNAKSAEKIKNIWQKECALAACTMQMCYVEIIPSCKNNVCVGEPKPYEAYFAK